MRLLAFVLAVAALAAGCNPRLTTPEERHGAELYLRMCAVCHGKNGTGYKADQAPALTGAEFLDSVSDSFLRLAIAQGRTGTTMSAWAKDRGGPLEHADIAAIVTFLRAFRRA